VVETVVPIGRCCTTLLGSGNACTAQHFHMSRRWDVAKFCPLVVKLFPTMFVYRRLALCDHLNNLDIIRQASLALRLVSGAVLIMFFLVLTVPPVVQFGVTISKCRAKLVKFFFLPTSRLRHPHQQQQQQQQTWLSLIGYSCAVGRCRRCRPPP